MRRPVADYQNLARAKACTSWGARSWGNLLDRGWMVDGYQLMKRQKIPQCQEKSALGKSGFLWYLAAPRGKEYVHDTSYHIRRGLWKATRSIVTLSEKLWNIINIGYCSIWRWQKKVAWNVIPFKDIQQPIKPYIDRKTSEAMSERRRLFIVQEV